MENQDKKKELIIDAALKRFAHFGLSKTTMTEIANDLSLSKALLYYYFPDKISLYSAVLGNIISLMDSELKKGTARAANSHEALGLFLNKRQEFISKYYNLLDFTKITGSDLPEELGSMFKKAKQSEVAILTSILNKGMESGELDTCDPQETAMLLMEALGGIVFNVLKVHTRPFFPEKEQFDMILKRQQKLGIIFLKGLKKLN
ncbi:TetR family transcriptional regulator [Arcticibacter tournemirensis]|uniref:TetR/AcrR family transcriptional regulator n=1 Tax=Arcticibacter tournemirensis TaxID=699437 RepID=A0A4V1KHU2_9SPHI|nr:TetR/AcrR family transcriptional regulator [Arcticibacter tournemirensis]KAA8482608.1 TetR/AcrR family transcriptional regulator [Arcticibacter tournemirensis]RXF68382.1 TetR/AcrR family transcriptional regulator [Arcticibacter tournemirensis]TQM52583.1 TetR family transcriptional regulator [Arcticibacter tournemirensis]